MVKHISQTFYVYVGQDGYLGLRCLEAKGRFLQARRRAPHSLCFFSAHWGVWEQWQVTSCTSQFSTATLQNENAMAEDTAAQHTSPMDEPSQDVQLPISRFIQCYK